MKLVTFTYKDRTRVGIWDGEQISLASWDDYMVSIVRRGIQPSRTSEHYAVADVKLNAPLIPGKIIGIGRNYAEHAAETGADIPAEPLLFAKLNTSVIGNGDMITWSESITTQVDWEGELGVVIGKTARNVREADAYNHIYGYTVANDVSARDLQSNDGQWIRAKGLDTFGPLGPCLVTRDEIADPHDLTIATSVNGEQLQYASTGLMLYKIPQLIAYCSRAFTLQPGDVILTGTPAGVGKGMKPPRFLKDGDEVSVSIDGIGTITNRCQII